MRIALRLCTSLLVLMSVALIPGSSAWARVSHGYTGVFSLHIGASAVPDTGIPGVARIAGIHPNPFNPSATIVFEVAEPGIAEVTVYDLAGRLVRRLESGPRPGGRYETTWDGRDDRGRGVSTGVYFCRLKTEHGTATRKMTLTK